MSRGRAGKGSEPGAHTLSGAIMDPRALTELIPDWKEKGRPEPAGDRRRHGLPRREELLRTPNWLLPKCFHNEGNYIVRLGFVTKWLAEQAEALGVEIFPGFAAEVLYNEDGSVKGVATGNMGISKEGEPTGDFQLGMELHGKYTIFAEGARGHLGKQIIAKYSLDANRDPQTYGLGIKELWEIDPKRHKPGMVLHTAGWPMKSDTYGGAFLYHLEDNWSRWASSPAWTTPTPICLHSRRCSAGRPIPISATTWKATKPRASSPPSASATVRAPSRPAASPACPLCLPRRRAGGLRSRLPQRQPHQGQPCRDQDRHAGRRSRLRRHRRRSPGRRADGLYLCLREQLAL
jgi:hypothetical protein